MVGQQTVKGTQVLNMELIPLRDSSVELLPLGRQQKVVATVQYRGMFEGVSVVGM
jgi:hypothetical protein